MVLYCVRPRTGPGVARPVVTEVSPRLAVGASRIVPGRRIAVAKLYVALGLLVLMLVFVLQNTSVVTLRFLFWERAVSQIVVLLVTGAAAFLAGLLLGKFGSRKT